MNQSLKALARSLLGSLRDLLPVILVVMFFQLAVLQQPLPNLDQLLLGTFLLVLGLTFFVNGLEMGLFPVGESLEDSLQCVPGNIQSYHSGVYSEVLRVDLKADKLQSSLELAGIQIQHQASRVFGLRW